MIEIDPNTYPENMNRCSKVDRGLSTVLKVIDVPLAMPDSDDEEIKAEFSICEHAFGYRESTG